MSERETGGPWLAVYHIEEDPAPYCIGCDAGMIPGQEEPHGEFCVVVAQVRAALAASEADKLISAPPHAQSINSGGSGTGWTCKAGTSATDPPQECDWPMCGCDPKANEVIAALDEAVSTHAETFAGSPHEAPSTWAEGSAQRVFVAGARWWMLSGRKGAEWLWSDQRKAEAAAVKFYGAATKEQA